MASETACVLDLDSPPEPGPVEIDARNELPPPYAVAFDMFSINEGHAFDEFVVDMDAIRLRLQSEPYSDVLADGYPAYVTAFDQVEVRTGESGQLTGTLAVGTYVIECTSPLEVEGEFLPIAEAGPIDVSE